MQELFPQGLRVQENNKFLKFWKIVQEEASKVNSVFFLDSGEGNEIETPEINAEDLSGWLIPKEQASEFDVLFKSFDNEKISQKFDNFYMIASWQKKQDSFSVTFA